MDKIKYYNYNTKTSVVVINIPGRINIDNKKNNNLKLEVDYNNFSEEQLKKIKNNKEELFNNVTNCITYNENKEKIKGFYIPILVNNSKEFKCILTDNNYINFSMIKNIIEIYKKDRLIDTIKSEFTKTISFNLEDGEYIFKFYIYNTEDEFICSNEIEVILKTNYYKLDNNKSKEIIIDFNEKQGDFSLKLSADSSRLYRFVIDDIETKNDKIIDFTFYNEENNDIIQRGKIGSIFSFLSEKQIEEIEKNPELENYVKGTFVFNIQELLSPIPSENDIGIIRLPTMRSKLHDNLNYYYDLKCNIEDNKNINFSKDENILITDKFNKTPLFYKFIINKYLEKIKIFDIKNNIVDNYIIEKITDNIYIVYFQPLRDTQYFYKIDDKETIYNIKYKNNKYPFIMEITKNFYDEENPIYFSDIVLKSEDKELEFEIIFDDYLTKNIKLKSTKENCTYLENERVKINKKVIGFKCISEKEFKIFNMIGNVKNNRTDLIFFKNNINDFVYIAKEYNTVILNNIPDEEIAKMKIGNKYIYIDKMIEVNNGPLELKDLELKDIIFTDIEEYKTEEGIAITDSYSIKENNYNNDFFDKNVKETSMEAIYENKRSNK